MTKTAKAVIFFISMRMTAKYPFGQAMLLMYGLFLCACYGKKEESPVIPPVTSPLSGEYIGFAVINVSFTHVMAQPEEGSESLGYLRRGSLVRVIERRTITSTGGPRTWVLTEGPPRGWLREDVMDIYGSESQAKTASESVSR
jgi:hypothetical protein